MTTLIYHNPRCSKSRKAVELLNQHKVNYNIIEYLKDNNLTEKDLKNLVKLLGLPIRDLLRHKEQAYKDNNIDNPKLSNQDLIKIILKNPILLERPIVVHGNKAKICRPPELVLELI